MLDESDESVDHTSVGGPTAATRPAATEVGESEEEQGGGSASSDAAVLAFLGCGAAEMWPYRRYVAAESPFATQHGVKGAEFDRVLVVMDEEESDFNLYNYEKYFGITPLSSNDQKKIDAGEDNILARTRRLLYVCCTRAKRDLVLVLFTTDESSAREKVKSSGLMPEDSIMSSDSFAAMST